jgi:hypothetical protein
MLPVLSPEKGAFLRVNQEKIMSRKSFIFAVVVCGAALAQSVPAVAGGVTDADLRGKKICWNTGFISSYNKDGSFDGNRAGHGTWSLNGDLVTVNAEHGSGASNISKDGDTFHSTRRASRSGKDIEAWGKYCN